MPKFWVCGLAVRMFFVLALRVPALAQGETTSAIVGSVADPAGAAIPGAVVTITNIEDGLKRAVRTDDAGRFSFPQLKPGTYSVKAEADRFEAQQNNRVSASLGQKQTVDFKLNIASASESILVREQAPLLNPGNPNTSTTLTAQGIENLPNPGGDMTYPLQFAAGALINTAGSGNDFVGGTNGYGNVQFNGLPSLSNGYIVDGLETNDPLTNLNSGLSTNLVLGLNSIAEVTVNTVSYAVDQGRYGASQVNYVTKSGTNRFHGNLYELWSGSRFDAADFFTNSTAGNHKPRSAVNHFGGSLGGPIVHDKLFFFFDSEWVRIALPIVNATTVPTPAFQQYVLKQLPLGGTDSVTGSVYQPAPQLVPFYKKLFSLYGNTAGTALPVLGCPFNRDGSAAGGNPPNGNGCANRQSVSHSSDDREQVQTARIDYNIDAKNTTWYRFQADTGLQAAYTDPINPLFNAISSQPLYSFASGYTHVFSGHLVNYFNPAFSWYQSLFGPADLTKTLAAFPIVLQGSGANAPFTPLGGLDNTWVQGRRATRVFINDNLAWTVGSHDLRFGTNNRIFRLNDYDFGEGTVPLVTYATLPQFIYGIASTASTTFPLANSQPYNFLNLDFYAQDTWKLTRTLTWTFGVRDTYNSNPRNPHNAVARLAGSFDSISHDVNQPLSQVIRTQQATIFAATPAAILQPRTAIAWQFAPHTVLRSGFGLFSDILPGSVVDLVGTNPPYSKTFQGGLLGTAGGVAIAPGVPNSAIDAAAAANRLFNSGLASGALSCASALANPNSCLPPISITAVPDGKLHAPYFMQWSFAIEHQIRQRTQPASSVRGHARREPALPDTGERVSNRLRGLLHSFPIRAAQRSSLRTGDAIEHRRQQPLQRSPVDRRKTPGPRSSGPGQLHVEPLHGHSLQRWIPALRRRGHSFAAAGRAGPPIRSLRLRRAPQLHRSVRVSVAAPVPESHTGSGAQRMAGLRHGVLAQRTAVFGLERPVFGQRQWHRAGQRPAIRQRDTRRAAVRTPADRRRDSTWNHPVAEPRRVCLGRRPKHGRLCRQRRSDELPVRQSGPQRLARPPVLLERSVPDQVVPVDGTGEVAHRRSIL